MSRGHSKKRNSALLYSFLLRRISSALVEGDERLANRALKILKTSFRPDTELYRELRLANALVRTTVQNQGTASSLIQEAKAAARAHDRDALDREKSLLIRNVNHRLNADGLFYEQNVPEYRILATVQTLLNEWRVPTGDIERVARYEDVLTNHLMAEKSPESDGGLVESTTVDSRLLVRAMMRRLNERYAGALSSTQKDILRMHALSSDDGRTLRTRLSEIRDGLVAEIDAYEPGPDASSIGEARSRIAAEALERIDDDTVSRFMAYSALLDELKNKESE